MRMQEVFDTLEYHLWFRIDDRIRLENLRDYRLYAHKDRPGVVITIVGTPDSYVGLTAAQNIYNRAGIKALVG